MTERCPDCGELHAELGEDVTHLFKPATPSSLVADMEADLDDIGMAPDSGLRAAFVRVGVAVDDLAERIRALEASTR